jgi:hypothetical protein
MNGRASGWLVVLGALGGLAVGVGGCGESESGGLGDATSETAVMRALEGTGYRIAYRKVEPVSGYEAVAGRATNRRGGQVDFSVVIDKSGSYNGDDESADEGHPKPPVVRYVEGAGTRVGNVLYQVQAQSPYKVGHLKHFGRAWLESRGEGEMQIRISVAFDRLFAPQFRGQG